MRRLLWVAGLLVLLAGIPLFVFSEQTATYFAWTIDVPLTAAFLGAAYWASVAFEWLAARESAWANARVAVPSVFVFTTLTLMASLAHIDLFHFDSSFELRTRLVAWAWLAIYVTVPVAMVALWIAQRRARGEDPPRVSRLPTWLTALLAVQAAVMLALGAYLFLAPESAASLWPWPLTALTGRAVGAWVFSIGIAAAHSVWENDARRLRLGAVGYAAIAVLELVALARFRSTVDWGEPEAVLYVLFLLGVLVTGGALLKRGRSMERIA